MTDLAEHNLPGVPEWIRFPDPREAHRAAFEAWGHGPSRCVLVKFWLPDDPRTAGCGHWRFDVVHPDGRRRTAWVCGAETVSDESLVLQSAGVAVAELVKVTNQAR